MLKPNLLAFLGRKVLCYAPSCPFDLAICSLISQFTGQSQVTKNHLQTKFTIQSDVLQGQEFSCMIPSFLPSRDVMGNREKVFSNSVSILQCNSVCVLRYVQLHNPMDCSPLGSSPHEIFQAIILEQVAISYNRGQSKLRDQTCIFQVSCIGSRFFTTMP